MTELGVKDEGIGGLSSVLPGIKGRNIPSILALVFYFYFINIFLSQKLLLISYHGQMQLQVILVEIL